MPHTELPTTPCYDYLYYYYTNGRSQPVTPIQAAVGAASNGMCSLEDGMKLLDHMRGHQIDGVSLSLCLYVSLPPLLTTTTTTTSTLLSLPPFLSSLPPLFAVSVSSCLWGQICLFFLEFMREFARDIGSWICAGVQYRPARV